MKKKLKNTGPSITEIQLKLYKDPKRAKLALKLALEDFEKDNNLEILLDTLRLVAKAQGGLATLAKKTSISRQALNEALSPQGNPRLRNFQSVLQGLGLRMMLRPMQRPKTSSHSHAHA
jgi:probable addiction module antidote protein